MESRAAQFIERFEITSDLARSSAGFRVFARGGSAVTIQVTSPAGEQFSERAALTNGEGTALIWLGDITLWDTNSPCLYSVKFTLHGGGDEDVVHSYFGMRSLSAESIEGSTAPG